jgi:hypothetical protein
MPALAHAGRRRRPERYVDVVPAGSAVGLETDEEHYVRARRQLRPRFCQESRHRS